MSRVGKNPIAIPAGTTVTVDGQTIKAKGKLGERQMRLVDSVGAEVVDGQLVVLPKSRPERHRMMWGTMRSLAQSLVTGVTEGFTKNLEINGVGYRAQVEGKSLKLQLGFSHDVIYPIPNDRPPLRLAAPISSVSGRLLPKFAPTARLSPTRVKA